VLETTSGGARGARRQNVFSGSVVVDSRNTSGLGKRDIPPLVAVYTANLKDNQRQEIAFSRDGGTTWEEYAGNPVIDIHNPDFRDPKVFWHEATRKWVMVVSLAKDKEVCFYGSDDLIHWSMLSEFGPAGALGSPNWECPNLFPLRVENQPNQTRWVLKIDLGNGAYAGGSGAEYFVGEFDGEKFRSEQARELWVDYGKDFYAAQVWSDLPASGRRTVWLGWMNNWSYAQDVPTSPWRGAMTVPRELRLGSSPQGWRLIQAPIRELKRLRGRHFQLRDQDMGRANRALETQSVRGEALEIQAVFDFCVARPFGMKVRRGPSEETVVGYDPGRQEMFVDRNQSGAVDFNKEFPGKQAGPLAVEGKTMKFHVFVDASSVEVFGDDGRIVFTELIFPDPESRGLVFFAEHGQVRLAALDIWQLRSIWS